MDVFPSSFPGLGKSLHLLLSLLPIPLTDDATQSWDAFDFFTVSLTVHDLGETFDKTNTQITWGITLVLMFRSVGSIIFGLAAEY